MRGPGYMETTKLNLAKQYIVISVYTVSPDGASTGSPYSDLIACKCQGKSKSDSHPALLRPPSRGKSQPCGGSASPRPHRTRVRGGTCTQRHSPVDVWRICTWAKVPAKYGWSKGMLRADLVLVWSGACNRARARLPQDGRPCLCSAGDGSSSRGRCTAPSSSESLSPEETLRPPLVGLTTLASRARSRSSFSSSSASRSSSLTCARCAPTPFVARVRPLSAWSCSARSADRTASSDIGDLKIVLIQSQFLTPNELARVESIAFDHRLEEPRRILVAALALGAGAGL